MSASFRRSGPATSLDDTDRSTRCGESAQLELHALLETVYRPPHVTTAVRAMVRDGQVTRERPTASGATVNPIDVLKE